MPIKFSEHTAVVCNRTDPKLYKKNPTVSVVVMPPPTAVLLILCFSLDFVAAVPCCFDNRDYSGSGIVQYQVDGLLSIGLCTTLCAAVPGCVGVVWMKTGIQRCTFHFHQNSMQWSYLCKTIRIVKCASFARHHVLQTLIF